MSPAWINGYVLFVGMCVGSFLNVCIHRLPQGTSIVSPPSACPKCGASIRWYDNIPVISYLLLRGRCRGCKTHISIRYPIVELITGLFALITWMQFGLTPAALIYFAFIAAMLVITFIDIDLQIIPDVISLPGIPIGFAASFLLPDIGWLNSLIGIAAGGGILYAVMWGYQAITGKAGMGFGDVKLLAMIGAFIGWKGVLFTIMSSSFFGTVVGGILMLKSGKGLKTRIPFGPFIAAGGILYLFLGPQIIHWYFGIL